MPTYDYECRACGKTFEIFHSMSEPARTVCPACKKKKLERLIGAGSGFIFKGSGFYITDYRSPDYKARAKADSEASSPRSEDSSKASGKSEGPSGSRDATSASGASGKDAPAAPKKEEPSAPKVEKPRARKDSPKGSRN
ncbi:MAG TPA: FmdB family zinc ribbon protein [Planctomycetota bacterium]|nr:FmdB family zinc ribbon protein [Planctomycetota bacterium]